MACSGLKDRLALKPSLNQTCIKHINEKCGVKLSSKKSLKGLRVCAAVAIGDSFLNRPSNFNLYKQKPQKNPPSELLSQMRKRKEEERHLREESREEGQDIPVWTYWRKRRDPTELEARQLTRKVVQLSKRKQLDQIIILIENARKEKKRLNLITMNAVLAACVHCCEIDKAFDFYYKMIKTDGVGADSITYGTLLKGLGQAKRLDDAFELLENMERKKCIGNYSLSEVHLNTLINACAEAGDALRAKSVLSRYKKFSNGGSPSTFTYNLLIKGYARSDNPLEALKVYEEMKLLNLEIERLTFNSIILACIRGKDVECALDLLEEMKEDAQRLSNPNLLPDVVTYTTLIQGLAEEKDLDGLLKIVKEMKEMENCKIDRVAYTAIIDAFIAAGSPEEGLKTLKEMEEKSKENSKLSPRPHVFLALLRSFSSSSSSCEEGSFEMCKRLCHKMIKRSSGNSQCIFVEEKLQALQFVFESAVVSNQYTEAKRILSFILSIKEPNFNLSERVMQSLVKLMVADDFAANRYKPILIRENICLKSTVVSFVVEKENVPFAYQSQTVSSVIQIFNQNKYLTVLDEENDYYVGIVHAKDCVDLNQRLCDIMHPLPPKLSLNSSVNTAIETFFEFKTQVLPVVNDRGHSNNSYLRTYHHHHHGSNSHHSNGVSKGDDVEEIDWNEKIFKPIVGFVFLSDFLAEEEKPRFEHPRLSTPTFSSLLGFHN